MTGRRVLLPLLAAICALCACGPTLPIKAGLAPAGANVFFGQPYAPSPLPVPAGANPLPEFPAPLEPALASLPPSGSRPACPAASPLAGPLQSAPVVPSGGPAPGDYVYRVSGSQTLNGKRVPLPAAETRTVKKVAKITDTATGSVHWQFAVAEGLGDMTTTMVYDLEPGGPAPGLYLLQITDSAGDSFTPSAGIQLMPFPAAAGISYPSANWAQGSGVDPIHDEAMSIQSGAVLGEARVDACGTVLDSWQVEIKGTIGDAHGTTCPTGGSCGQQRSFDLTFDDGTLYGGLVLADHLVETGVDATTNQTFGYDITAIADSEPQVAR